MKAIGYKLPVDQSGDDTLLNIELPRPTATNKDLLVQVEAVSVNPVDVKIRQNVTPTDDTFKVLGWDAVGTVEEVGSEAGLFEVGDRVWYAGAIDRSGSNAQYQLVDERIVSKAPSSLSNAQAAALPLTTITAWEILFDRFKFNKDSTGTLLVVGAAGGVGSIMIQLAKKLTNLTVIATASRTETSDWVKRMGADYVINHNIPLDEALKTTGLDSVDAIAALTFTDKHLSSYVEIIAPQGQISVIDDPAELDIKPFKMKSVSVHWEFMYTRSLFQTDDMIEQHKLLSQVASMVDQGEIETTLTQELGSINADNLMKAHQFIESGKAIGKVVLEGF